MYDAAIVGGGITGLTIAHRLVRDGKSVALFEPGPLGGVIRTVVRDGFTLETGPNVILAKPGFRRLIEELNLSSALVPPIMSRYRQFVWHNGKATIVPKAPHLLAATPLIDLPSKLSLPYKIAAKGLSVAADDESVADFFARIIGKRAVERLLDPVLKGIFGGDAQKLSARSLFPELWRTAREGRTLLSYLKQKRRTSGPRELFVLSGGNQTLVDALAARVQNKVHHVQEGATSVRRQGDHYLVESAGTAIEAKSVFLTTSGAATSPLIRSFDAPLADALMQSRAAALSVVHLAVPEASPIPERSFGILFPKGTVTGKEAMPLLGVMFNSKLFPQMTQKGQELLTVCLGGVGAEQVVAASDDSLGDAAVHAALRYLQCPNSTVLHVTRWPRAIPQQEVGHWSVVEKMKQVEERNPRLLFVGADRAGVSVPDRIEAAYSAPLV